MEVVVGTVGRAHGIRGEVSVDLRTDDPDTRFAVGAVLRPEPSSRGALTVRSTRPHGDRLLVTFAEVRDRSEAELLRGASLLVDVAPGTRTGDPDEYYDHQLVGLRVRTRTGHDAGTVTQVQHLPGQDMLVVETSGRTSLVPFVTALVPEVDLSAGELVVDARPGLLDDDTPDRAAGDG